MPPGIYRLPLELVREVAAKSSSRDIAALALTGRHFHAWVNPCLYEHNIKHEEADAAVWAAAHGRLDTLLLLHQANTGSSEDFITKVWSGSARYGPLLSIQSSRWQLTFTLLHLAAQGGHDDMVKWLLQQGADVNASSTNFHECPQFPTPPSYWTPLHLAICHSQEKTVKLLLAHNASLRMNKKVKIGALHTAAAKGLTSTICHLSTLPGFNVNVKDLARRTPLDHAIMFSGSFDAIKTLIGVGADVQGGCGPSSLYPDTPLWTAFAQGDLEVAVLLLENGAKPFVNKDNDRKRVAPYRQQLRRHQRFTGVSLMEATLREENATENSVRHGVLQRKVIRALLDFGCDVNEELTTFDEVQTPLHLAVRNSRSVTVRLLLEKGAEVRARDRRPSALFCALSKRTSASVNERVDKVTALLEHGANLLDHNVICAWIVERNPRALMNAVAVNMSPENLNDSLKIPRVLGLCSVFQEHKIYDSIKRNAAAQIRAADEDILYVLFHSASSKRACVPASLDELDPILDDMRPGLTVDGVLDQWRDVMTDTMVKWLEEIKERESSGRGVSRLDDDLGQDQ